MRLFAIVGTAVHDQSNKTTKHNDHRNTDPGHRIGISPEQIIVITRTLSSAGNDVVAKKVLRQPERENDQQKHRSDVFHDVAKESGNLEMCALVRFFEAPVNSHDPREEHDLNRCQDKDHEGSYPKIKGIERLEVLAEIKDDHTAEARDEAQNGH